MTTAPPKTVLVTGAGRRVGRGIAWGLAQAGWRVCAHYHASAEGARALVADIRAAGGTACLCRADLECAEATAGLIDQCRAASGGPVTALVNNASIFDYDDARDFTDATWDRHHAVNLKAPALLARAFARALPAEATGAIVNILDQKVLNLNPDYFSYTISKLGLHGLTLVLAQALAPRIRVNAVAPGLTLPSGGQTAESFARAHATAPLGQGNTVEDVAAAVRYLLDSPHVTGQVLAVDGGQHLVPLGRDVMFTA